MNNDMLSVLNDDCLYKIFEWLSLDELCLYSRTCKRLQGLCENHFHRRFPIKANGQVEIEIGINGKLKYERYVRYFPNFIKNLKIINSFGQSRGREVAALTNFVKTKCHQNFYKVSIVGNVKLVPFCKDIKGFLSKVKVVQFMYGTESGQEEATFLKYCPEIRQLVLLYTTKISAILQQIFRQLTHFHCIYINSKNLNTQQLKMFYQNNNKIQCAFWKFDQSYCNTACGVVQSVVEKALGLQHFLLRVDSSLTKRFEDICSDFEVLCTRESFKSLEIEFDNTTTAFLVLTLHANQLATFTQLRKIVVSIFGGNIYVLSDVIPLLRSLVHLKIIVLRYFRYLAIRDDTPALPQVEELQIELCSDELFSADMKHFTSYWPNLKRILLPQCVTFNTKFEIAEWNRARENLQNACELTIFMDNKENETILDHKLVKLEFADFETDEFDQSILSQCCMPSVE